MVHEMTRYNMPRLKKLVCMYVYIYIILFIKHAPLLWSNTTCYKFTC